MEARETLLLEVKEKRSAVESLKKQILDCNKYYNHYIDMKVQLSHIKEKDDIDPNTLEEYGKLQEIINQQKLQLQSEVHFLFEKELVFVNQASNVVIHHIFTFTSHK